MTQNRMFLGLGLAIGLTVLACSGGGSNGDDLSASSSGSNTSSSGSSGTAEPTPKQEVTVSPPSTALEVTATIIAVTLGDDCESSGGLQAGDCAPDAEGGGCGSICQQSNMQLSFETGAGTSAKVEITAVTLHDAKTGAKLDDLEAKSPRSWTGSAYAAWDQTLAPTSTVKASYDLSAPSWSTITNGKGTYSGSYRLRVAMKIDGVAVVLESAELSREPAVAT